MKTKSDWIRIETLCKNHTGDTLVSLHGEIAHTDCPTFKADFETAGIYPDADIATCAAVALLAIAKIRGTGNQSLFSIGQWMKYKSQWYIVWYSHSGERWEVYWDPVQERYYR